MVRPAIRLGYLRRAADHLVMGERAVALYDWLERSELVAAATPALVDAIADTQSAIALEISEWHELMDALGAVEARIAARRSHDAA
jgi:hypothetical protein